MENELNLSEKIHESNNPKEKGLLNYPSFLWVSDVKEFIKVILNDVKCGIGDDDRIRRILKHAGNKLIENKQ